MSTLAQLRTKFRARGFTYLSDDTDVNDRLNAAMHELDDLARWPYLEKGVTGTAPLQVSDLGQVEAVIDTSTSTELDQASYTDLLAMYGGNLSTTGSPWFWYLAWPGGVPTVATYPVSTDTIGCQYWRVAPDLSNDSDSPLAPARYHGIILDIAVREAYRNKDMHQAADALQASIDRRVARMMDALLSDQGPRFVQVTNATDA